MVGYMDGYIKSTFIVIDKMDSKRTIRYTDFSTRRQLKELDMNMGSPKWMIMQLLLLFYRFPENCFYAPKGVYKFHQLVESTIKEIEIIWEVRARRNPYYDPERKIPEYTKIEGKLLLPSELQDDPVKILGNCVNTGRFICILLSLKMINYDTGKIEISHANMLLFDRLEAKVFRFDPHGITNSMYQPEQLDIVLRETFDQVFRNLLFVNAEDNAFDYLIFPDFFMGPQVRQHYYYPQEIDPDNIKRNILVGNCAVWCYIFTYLRMFYTDLPLASVLQIMGETGPGGHNTFESVYIITKILYGLLNTMKKSDHDPMPIIRMAWDIQIEKYFFSERKDVQFIATELDEEGTQLYELDIDSDHKTLKKYQDEEFDSQEQAVFKILQDALREVIDKKYTIQQKKMRSIWIHLSEVMKLKKNDKKEVLLKVKQQISIAIDKKSMLPKNNTSQKERSLLVGLNQWVDVLYKQS